MMIGEVNTAKEDLLYCELCVYEYKIKKTSSIKYVGESGRNGVLGAQSTKMPSGWKMKKMLCGSIVWWSMIVC